MGDDHHVRAVGQAGLDEQGGVQHDDDVLVVVGLQAVGDPGEDLRVGDLVEDGQLGRVGEDDVGQRLAVDGAVGVQHATAEVVADLVPGMAARHHHLAGDVVGVDDLGAPLGQQRRDRALARRDAPGEPHQQHSRPLKVSPAAARYSPAFLRFRSSTMFSRVSCPCWSRSPSRASAPSPSSRASSSSAAATWFWSWTACLRDREMRRRSRSMSMTLTVISSPTLTTCSGMSTWRSASSEMWTRPSMPSSTRTKAPNGTSLVTRPGMSSPIWWERANWRQGSSWVAFSDSETRSRSRSTSRTSTSTSWPTSTTSEGWSMCFHDSSETCTSPSTPPRSTKAPKFTIEETTPLRISPLRRVCRNARRVADWVSSSQARRDRTTLLRFLSSSMILASSVRPT